MDKEFKTKEFIRETDLMVERLKGYKKVIKKQQKMLYMNGFT